ncbi:MAG: hypothetical protein AAGF88_13430 [Pseudomonadota bacterium]
MRRNLLGVLLGFALLGLFSTAAAARCSVAASSVSDGMTFSVVSDGSTRWIAAQGRITAESAARLEQFLAGLSDHPDTIVLHSPGGRLMGGLALGRAIRAAGLATRIGQAETCTAHIEMEPGLCASSCAYAFLGGVDRELGDTGILGFHRIYPAAGQAHVSAAELADATLAAMLAVRRYLDEMGAHPHLAELADRVGEHQLFIPRGPLLSVLGIETGPVILAATEMAEPARL